MKELFFVSVHCFVFVFTCWKIVFVVCVVNWVHKTVLIKISKQDCTIFKLTFDLPKIFNFLQDWITLFTCGLYTEQIFLYWIWMNQTSTKTHLKYYGHSMPLCVRDSCKRYPGPPVFLSVSLGIDNNRLHLAMPWLSFRLSLPVFHCFFGSVSDFVSQVSVRAMNFVFFLSFFFQFHRSILWNY